MRGFSKLAKVGYGYSLLFFSENSESSMGGLSGAEGVFIYLTYYFVS